MPRTAAPTSQPALPDPTVGGTPPSPAKVYAVGALAGTAAGVTTSAPALPLIKVQQETVEGIVAAFKTFFVGSRSRQDAFVVQRFKGRLPQQDVLDVIADETARQAEFERRVILRVRRDATKALQIADPDKRSRAVTALLVREQHYARFRAEAMAVRAFSALDRVVLRQTSPEGALWVLDPNVQEHTPDCVAMGGHVWPWAVLDLFHPPTHAGCRCHLRKIPDGSTVPDVIDAMARMKKARDLLHESDYLDLRERLVAAGLRYPGLLDAARLSRC